MNRNLSILALTGTLALGGIVGYAANERTAQIRPAQTQSQSTQATTSTPTTSSTRGQMVQTLAPGQAAANYDNGRARTESEANTVQVVKDRQGGLVYISVTESAASTPEAQLRQRLQRQFGLPDSGSGEDATGTGSGFFVSSGGDIITNNHVVEGASEITVRLHGSKATYKAKVVARAPDFDLALIRAEGVPAADINPLPLGNSDGLDVGLKAIAMGAPFGLDFSVSEGIISSLERTVPVGTRGVEQNVIQTDAAINPGNSGGPLLNSAGQVIGVNTQILTGGIGQSAGVGFAIPVNTVKNLLPQLQAGKGGQDAVLRTPSLGIGFTDVSDLTGAERRAASLPETGALVGRVYPGSPADRAGLKGSTVTTGSGGAPTARNDGDVIVAVDGQPLTDASDLPRTIIGKQIGDDVKLTVRRAGKTRDVTVQLQAFDFPQSADQ